MSKVRAIVVGTGGFARYHIQCMREMQASTAIVDFVEPGQASRDATRAIFAAKNIPCPPEVGLRFAQLMDMIRQSAKTGRTVAAGPRDKLGR